MLACFDTSIAVVVFEDGTRRDAVGEWSSEASS